ncbi:O-antigen ligase family protein [Rhizobacter sp. SG703]|uniref:PglL family O-oligosaccharyltransferase n=1 Tax=Rhizobacter sp. SG703 TaxID=2587140 RepID=UPI00144792BC|nr:O-antigen ligase family protein [Rhizobacter sp. SG703]NKI94430.1 O-antigen ligase [Rhizobacter sp. SG703]
MQRSWYEALLLPLACIAIAVPALLAFNVPPSATFLNQAVALLGWGGFTAAFCCQLAPGSLRWRDGGALSGALLVMGVAVLATAVLRGLPWPLAASAFAVLFAAGWVVSVATALRRSEKAEAAFRATCIALVAAGLLSLVVGFVQYFAPRWADGAWIAIAATPGRIGGNLRQPNHLSTLLLFSLIAGVWLHERFSQRLTQAARAGLIVFAVIALLGVVLTGSRTGALCTLFLSVWGVFDRGLSRRARLLLGLSPIAYVGMWVGMDVWAHHSSHVFGGEAQLNHADLSSSRFAIWNNTLSLIAQNPWTGVGWGEFNFAWSLTPFPGRPVAFFDHTHNLPLQLLVELGIPVGLFVLALLLWALWRSFSNALADTPSSGMVRCAFMMVLTMAVHSELEYPLWYAYFLLPTAFMWGLSLVGGPDEPAPGVKEPSSWPQGVWLGVVSALLIAGTCVAIGDYLSVVRIFSPGDSTASLPDRIRDGQRSLFFAHHADYAAATTTEPASDALEAYRRAPHYLLDARLMQSWATALEQSGDTDRARYVAQRLKEFRNPQNEGFFAVCDHRPAPGEALPFQCLAPSRPLDYEDFR